MIDSSRRWLAGLAAAAALFPTTLAGQAVTQSFDERQPISNVGQVATMTDGTARSAIARAGAAAGTQADHWHSVVTVKPGTKSVVTLKTGEKRIGNFRRATADELTIAVRPKKGEAPAREETLPKALVATVALAADSMWNGALVGAGIGTGLAMWDYLIDPSEPGNAAIFAVAIGCGAAIGAGIDALVNTGGTVLYASPRQKSGVTVSPFVGRDQQGVVVSVRF